jgi:hypothetical protein
MQIIIPELARSPYAPIVIGSVIIGFAVTIYRLRRSGVSKQSVLYTCLLTFVCTLITSLIFSFKITSEGIGAGFSGLGAAVGMIAGVFISGLIIKDKPEIVMAAFVSSAPLMYALAKTGCLLAGCCHGKEYYGPFAVIHTGGEHAGSFFPAQIIDMIAFLALHVFALILTTKMKNKVHAIYLILAVTIPVRFLLEYLKYTHDGSLISSGQITVLIAGAVCLIIVFLWQKLLKIGSPGHKTEL